MQTTSKTRQSRLTATIIRGIFIVLGILLTFPIVAETATRDTSDVVFPFRLALEQANTGYTLANGGQLHPGTGYRLVLHSGVRHTAVIPEPLYLHVIEIDSRGIRTLRVPQGIFNDTRQLARAALWRPPGFQGRIPLSLPFGLSGSPGKHSFLLLVSNAPLTALSPYRGFAGEGRGITHDTEVARIKRHFMTSQTAIASAFDPVVQQITFSLEAHHKH